MVNEFKRNTKRTHSIGIKRIHFDMRTAVSTQSLELEYAV